MNDSIHAQSWADETEFNYHHPNPLNNTKFDENKSADKLDQILLQMEQMNSHLTTMHNNLTFTTHRVQKIEDALNIFTLTPEKAAALNEAEKGKPDHMQEETEYEPEVDTSDSVVLSITAKFENMEHENRILKASLTENFEKLNTALQTIATLQNMVYNTLNVPQSKKTPI